MPCLPLCFGSMVGIKDFIITPKSLILGAQKDIGNDKGRRDLQRV